MSAITAAIRFLTVVPSPGGDWSASAAARSVAWFPVVGLGIGGAVAAVNWAARLAMPDLPAAALALAPVSYSPARCISTGSQTHSTDCWAGRPRSGGSK